MKMSVNKEYHLPIEDIDKIIHEPARLKIMIYLNVVENADFIYLLHKIKLSKGNLSSHLSKLEQAGYIKIEKEFVDKIPRTLVSISKEGTNAFSKYKNSMLKLLNSI